MMTDFMYNFNTRCIQLFVFNNRYIHGFNYDILLDILTAAHHTITHKRTYLTIS